MSTLNNWQIDALSNLGDSINRLGRIGGQIAYDADRAKTALLENQAKSVYSQWKSVMFDENGMFNKAVSNAKESDFGNFQNYLRTSAWDEYASEDYIRKITGNRYSDEVYSNVMSMVNEDGRLTFDVNSSVKSETANEVMLKSTFMESFGNKITIQNDDGKYDWIKDDNDDYFISGVESAENLKKHYNDTKDSFIGFDIANTNGVLDMNSASMKETLSQVGFTEGVAQITSSVAKFGSLVTTADAEMNIKRWFYGFGTTIGLTKDEVDALYQSNSSLISESLQKAKDAEQNKVSENLDKAYAQLKGKGYSFSETLDFLEANGFGDYEENYYTNAELTSLVNAHYGVNMDYYDRDTVNVLEYYINGEGKQSIDWESLGKAYIVGNNVPTSIKDAVNGTGTTKTVEGDGVLFNGTVKILIQTPTLSENNTVMLNYADVTMAIAKAQGKEDDYQFIRNIDEMITNKVIFDTSENGVFGQIRAGLWGVVNDNRITMEAKSNEVQDAFDRGYITREEYNELNSKIEFKYGDQLDDVNTLLKNELGADFYNEVILKPDMQSYIRKQIDGAQGEITGKSGQALIDDIKKKANYMRASNLTTSYVTEAFNSLFGNDYYLDGILTDLGQCSVNDIMYKYNNGEMDIYGINIYVDQAIPLIQTKKDSASDKEMEEEILETIWKNMNYEGTYKDSKDIEKKGLVNLTALVAIARTAQDSNMSYAIGPILDYEGKAPTNVLVSIGGRNLPAVVSEDGIVIMQTEDGSPTYMIGSIDKTKVQEAKRGFISDSDIAFERGAFGLPTRITYGGTDNADGSTNMERVVGYQNLSYQDRVSSYISKYRGVSEEEIVHTRLEADTIARNEYAIKMEEKESIRESLKEDIELERQRKAKGAKEIEPEVIYPDPNGQFKGGPPVVINTPIGTNFNQLKERVANLDLRITDKEAFQALYRKAQNGTINQDEVALLIEVTNKVEKGEIDADFIKDVENEVVMTESQLKALTNVPKNQELAWMQGQPNELVEEVVALHANRKLPVANIKAITTLDVLELYYKSLPIFQATDTTISNAYQTKKAELQKKGK